MQVLLESKYNREWQDKLNDLANCVSISCDNGNWNYSLYMNGMANGLILAWSIMTETEPKYIGLPTHESLFNILESADIDDLKIDTDPGRKERSKPVASFLKKVNKSGKVLFNSTAITTKGVKFWQQSIKPVESIPRLVTLKEIREYYNGDVLISCTCPDFLYHGFDYMASIGKYKLGRKETRYPKIRNPKLEGSVCKHLYNTIGVLRSNIPKVINFYRKAWK